MKLKKRIFISITLIAAISFVGFTAYYNLQRDKLLLDIIGQSLSQIHYQKNKFDDDFSKGVFDNFMSSLDRNKNIFLQEDYESFVKYESVIDEEMKEQTLNFFDEVNSKYEERFDGLKEYFDLILEQAFDYTLDEMIENDDEKSNYPVTEEARKEKWRKILKYETMRQVYSKMEAQKKAKAKNDSTVLKSFELIEREVREKLQKEYNDWFHRVEKYERKDRYSIYLNTLTAYFDPHTNYYSPKDKANFDISMSGQLEGIGATLQESDGYVKVVSIVPGGPAWKHGDLKAGDLILEVAQGEEESVNIIDMRLDDAVQLIRGKKGTIANLTIRKPDGDEMNILIVRDKVVLEETYARSAILNNPNSNEKVGYLYLPKFYANFQEANGRRSAKDIKKELIKLNDEGVSSLVFDLRNNTGGSLNDVVEMFGYFISTGPVVQVKDNQGKIRLHEDKDNEILFKKPLVVLINEGSASASEIFAAAVQDYGRGIILGSPSSFGKGTVQRILDFDHLVNSSFKQYKPLGALKITIQKFYRITGASTQLKGVSSDVVLADSYMYLPVGEREQEHAMPWDEIENTEFSIWTCENMNKAIKNSKKRIAKDTLYTLLDNNAMRLKNMRDETLFSLKYTDYEEVMNKRNEEYKQYKTLNTTKSSLKMNALAKDLKRLEGDSTKTKIWTQWVKSLQNDYYLDEAFRVAIDLN
ncbi:MAG: carboxy terminal-processing peptidase [Bacteroidales bacterium]|nr:carboxy terminal-processing peptidase [Bacteroidales bacterium]